VGSGRWRDVCIINGDGSITFLDGALKAGGGHVPLRTVYWGRERPWLRPLAGGSVEAVISDGAGEKKSVLFEKLAAMGNEVEDRDYDKTGIGTVQLKPAPFRIWLPVGPRAVA